MQEIAIAGRKIGRRHPPYIIAELSGNHNGDIGRALALIDAAKEAGADAVKLQTYTPDSLTIDADSPDFVIHGGLWDNERLYQLYQRAQTPYDWFPQLFAHGREVGITVFSSPFDAAAVDLLERLDAPAYKIASPEIEDWPLIERVVKTGRPIIISTGQANTEVIDETVAFAHELGAKNFALLHCISAYPAPIEDANLRTMADLAARFDGPVGLSDHTMGTTAAVAAVALGATVIEKHVTLARADGGVDSSFSLEPHELARLVTDCRDAFNSLGGVIYGQRESERAATTFRRVFYAIRDIAEGEILGPGNIRSIRGPRGLSTRHYRDVFGRRAARAIARHSPIERDAIAAERT